MIFGRQRPVCNPRVDIYDTVVNGVRVRCVRDQPVEGVAPFWELIDDPAPSWTIIMPLNGELPLEVIRGGLLPAENALLMAVKALNTIAAADVVPPMCRRGLLKQVCRPAKAGYAVDPSVEVKQEDFYNELSKLGRRFFNIVYANYAVVMAWSTKWAERYGYA
jgi:hypothetical protein